AKRLQLLLGAVHDDGSPTELGKKIAELPVHPRLARMLLFARDYGLEKEASAIAAILGERSLMRNRSFNPGEISINKSDVFDELDILQNKELSNIGVSPKNDYGCKMRIGASSNFPHLIGNSRNGSVDRSEINKISLVSRQLLEMTQKIESSGGRALKESGSGNSEGKKVEISENLLLQCLLAGFPDRVAKRRSKSSGGEPIRFLLVGGKGLTLDLRSGVQNSELVVALSVDGAERADTREGIIRRASHIDPEWLSLLFPFSCRTFREVQFDVSSQEVVVRQKRFYLDLLLEETPQSLKPQDQSEVEKLLVLEAKKNLREAFPLDPVAEQFLFRLDLLGRHFSGRGFPKIDDAFLEDRLPQLVKGCKSFHNLREIQFRSFFEREIGGNMKNQLDTFAPEKIRVPSGNLIRLMYQKDGPPILPVKIQEMFGFLEPPRILGGKLPVLIHLLSPAGRPLQITQDLKTFWENGYPIIRKEMRAQYPKHYWPEDPASTAPRRSSLKPRKTR
ncbi:hypothetical protein HYY75_09850, partial [bacterium]|nr:hypothetical protein [bacterium]